MYANHVLPIMLAFSVALTGCATTSSKAPKTDAERQVLQQELENKLYQEVWRDTVTASNGKPIDLIGRNRQSTPHDDTATERDLKIIRRSDTAKVVGLMVVSAVLTHQTASGFSKDQLKGKVFSPKVENRTLEFVRTPLNTWVQTFTKQYTLERPVSKVTVEPGRFYLVYDKLGQVNDAYQLTNTLTITVNNHWDSGRAYQYKCTKTSVSHPLTAWQINSFSLLHDTLKQQVTTCVSDLNTQQSNIFSKLSTNES